MFSFAGRTTGVFRAATPPGYKVIAAYLLQKAVHAGEVLAEDVELDVDYGADRNILEVGVLVGIGDDAHGYIALSVFDIGFAHSETDTVDADRTLVHTEVATLYHLPVGVVLKTIVPTAVRLTHLYATCGLVHVPPARYARRGAR